MRKAILFLAAALSVAACADLPVPQDQAQTVFALTGAYTATSKVELSYATSAHADPAAVSAIAKADQVAFDALSAAQAAVQSGATSAATAAAIAAAQDAMSALTDLLHKKGLI